MRSILLQLSGLAGILAFLTQMWSHSPLDQSLYTGVIVGGGVYIILLLVDVVIQRIIAAHVESVREKARARRNTRKDREQNAADTPDRKENASGQEDSGPAVADESSANSKSTDHEMAAV